MLQPPGSPPAIAARPSVVSSRPGVEAWATGDSAPPLGVCGRCQCLRRRDSRRQSAVEPPVPSTLPHPTTEQLFAQPTLEVRLAPIPAAVAPIHSTPPPTLGGATKPAGAAAMPRLPPVCGLQEFHRVDVEGFGACHASATAARLAGEREAATQL